MLCFPGFLCRDPSLSWFFLHITVLAYCEVFCIKQLELASCCTHCSASPSGSRCSQTIQAAMGIGSLFSNMFLVSQKYLDIKTAVNSFAPHLTSLPDLRQFVVFFAVFWGQAHLDLPLPECPAPVPWMSCCVLLQRVCLGIIIIHSSPIEWR